MLLSDRPNQRGDMQHSENDASGPCDAEQNEIANGFVVSREAIELREVQMRDEWH